MRLGGLCGVCLKTGALNAVHRDAPNEVSVAFAKSESPTLPAGFTKEVVTSVETPVMK